MSLTSPTDRGIFAIRPDHSSAVTVTVHGELDMAHETSLRETIHALGDTASTVVLDLSQVDFLDSTAVSIALDSRASLDAVAVDFLVDAPPSGFQRVFDIADPDSRVRWRTVG